MFTVVTNRFSVVTNLLPIVKNLFPVVTNLFPVVSNLLSVVTNPVVAHLSQHEFIQRGQSLGLLLIVLRVRQGLQKTLSRFAPSFVKNVLPFSAYLQREPLQTLVGLVDVGVSVEVRHVSHSQETTPTLPLFTCEMETWRSRVYKNIRLASRLTQKSWNLNRIYYSSLV